MDQISRTIIFLCIYGTVSETFLLFPIALKSFEYFETSPSQISIMFLLSIGKIHHTVERK